MVGKSVPDANIRVHRCFRDLYFYNKNYKKNKKSKTVTLCIVFRV